MSDKFKRNINNEGNSLAEIFMFLQKNPKETAKKINSLARNAAWPFMLKIPEENKFLENLNECKDPADFDKIPMPLSSEEMIDAITDEVDKHDLSLVEATFVTMTVIMDLQQALVQWYNNSIYQRQQKLLAEHIKKNGGGGGNRIIKPY